MLSTVKANKRGAGTALWFPLTVAPPHGADALLAALAGMAPAVAFVVALAVVAAPACCLQRRLPCKLRSNAAAWHGPWRCVELSTEGLRLRLIQNLASRFRHLLGRPPPMLCLLHGRPPTRGTARAHQATVPPSPTRVARSIGLRFS
ncbi:unnamed protein product [Prorocentrum cordatum]|uniref:Uncharacterized protein n=1 Tax=Prorocentrum cordatum TaxID=2364126 RepID=A0ABN9Y0N3_9DINO|nr:unnamed protein product [Polarella glacialis]